MAGPTPRRGGTYSTCPGLGSPSEAPACFFVCGDTPLTIVGRFSIVLDGEVQSRGGGQLIGLRVLKGEASAGDCARICIAQMSPPTSLLNALCDTPLMLGDTSSERGTRLSSDVPGRPSIASSRCSRVLRCLWSFLTFGASGRLHSTIHLFSSEPVAFSTTSGTVERKFERLARGDALVALAHDHGHCVAVCCFDASDRRTLFKDPRANFPMQKRGERLPDLIRLPNLKGLFNSAWDAVAPLRQPRPQ